LPSPSIRLSRLEDQLVTQLDDFQADMTAQTLKWSAQNSGSHHSSGLKKMRALLRERFSELPGDISELPLIPGRSVNAAGLMQDTHYEPALCVTVRPEAPIQLVLTGHYDTVFPKDTHFQTSKYIDADTINGPGTADMKGGLLVMCQALQTLERSDVANTVGYTVLMSPDEEIGSPGSAPLLAELGQKCHVGLTYEPALADGSLAGARKGSGNFALIIRGRAAHAGREHHLGRNAIAAMSRFVAELDDLNGQRDGVTFNIAKIDGGGASNIVPDLAIGRFNIRLQEDDDTVWIRRQLAKLIAHIDVSDGLSAELTGDFTRPPKPMSAANATVFNWVRQAGGLLGQDIRWAPSGGVCEGNNLWASGCPNVDTLGVIGGNIHSDREFMKLSSLVERARLSTVILLKIASGDFDAIAVKKVAQDHCDAAAHNTPC